MLLEAAAKVQHSDAGTRLVSAGITGVAHVCTGQEFHDICLLNIHRGMGTHDMSAYMQAARFDLFVGE